MRDIADAAFIESGLRAIVVPPSVAVLGPCCFFHCTRMESVVFGAGSGLRWMGTCAFHGCRVCRMVVPKSVEAIGAGCFKGCQSLRSLEVEKESRMVEIGEAAFDGTMIQKISLYLGHESVVAT